MKAVEPEDFIGYQEELLERLKVVTRAASKMAYFQWLTGCPCDGSTWCSFKDLCASLKEVGYAPPDAHT